MSDGKPWTAEELAARRRSLGLSRELVAVVFGRSTRWLMHIEEGRLPLSDDDARSLLMVLLAGEMTNPGYTAPTVPGSNLTSHQQSN